MVFAGDLGLMWGVSGLGLERRADGSEQREMGSERRK